MKLALQQNSYWLCYFLPFLVILDHRKEHIWGENLRHFNPEPVILSFNVYLLYWLQYSNLYRHFKCSYHVVSWTS